MNVKARLLAIKLAEKQKVQCEFSKKLGIDVKVVKKKRREIKD